MIVGFFSFAAHLALSHELLLCQLATNEKTVFLLGQHLLRLSKLQFTPYERSMYRRRAVQKWTPLVSYRAMWPALAVWLLYSTRQYVGCCCGVFVVYGSGGDCRGDVGL